MTPDDAHLAVEDRGRDPFGGDVLKRTHRLAQWVALGTLVGVFSGIASAAFLWLLDLATAYRDVHEVIVYALPLAGLVLGFVLQRWGGPVRGGNNLVIDTVHEDSDRIPLSVAPAVLGGTVLTHLFGGSAGREGAAVQMGAALADAVSHRFRVRRETRIQLLSAGIAGGFGSVFGTPIAGTVFGLEVVSLGRIEYTSLVPALVAAVVGDYTTRSLGIERARYPQVPFLGIDPLLIAKWTVFAVAVAAAAVAFVEITHRLRGLLERVLPWLPLRMLVGGAAVVLMWRLIGTSAYLGLSDPMLARAFTDPGLPEYAFAAKLLFTAVTLGSGFLGGEVTPLFVVGATLGNVLSRLLALPMALSAGVGMAAVFAAASNTPLALSIMAVELLGAGAFPHVVIVAVIAYLLTGHRSIYPSQRLLREKWDARALARPTTLRDFAKPSGGMNASDEVAERDGTGSTIL